MQDKHTEAINQIGRCQGTVQADKTLKNCACLKKKKYRSLTGHHLGFLMNILSVVFGLIINILLDHQASPNAL